MESSFDSISLDTWSADYSDEPTPAKPAVVEEVNSEATTNLPPKERFQRVVNRVITARYISYLFSGRNAENRKISSRKRLFYEWRVAAHYFNMKMYTQSVEILENVCKCEPSIRLCDKIGEDHSPEEALDITLVLVGENLVNNMPMHYVAPDKVNSPNTSINRSPSPASPVPSLKKKKLLSSDALVVTQAKGGEKSHKGEPVVYKRSEVHLLAARCRCLLFHSSRLHSHLALAYVHFQNSIETLHYDLTTMFRLPAILSELGRMLELYGHFEGALEVYAKILANFPNYRGYFHAMYRSALVGRHLIEIDCPTINKQSMAAKCIDIFQFLLEALPTTINEVHILLSYAKALEFSGSASMKFRSNSVYLVLFEFCQQLTPPLADADSFRSSREWIDVPQTWLTLAEYMTMSEEPLICRDCYTTYLKRLEYKRKPGQVLSDILGIEICIKIALNYACIQEYSNAIKFAQWALEKNHFHAEARRLLRLWSSNHEALLFREENSIQAITKHWKERAWTNASREMLKKQRLLELQEKHAQNRFDVEARRGLAYYDRTKWRSKFLFETACAIRIQRKFRERRKLWRWQAPQRALYFAKASNIFRRYCITPFEADIRQEVRTVTNHRLCPKKHKIVAVRAQIDLEDNSVNRIRKCYRSYKNRVAIQSAVEIRKQKRSLLMEHSAVKIQCAIRRCLAYSIYCYEFSEKNYRNAAASIIQQFVIWRNNTFQHSVTRMIAIDKARKIRAQEILEHVFGYHLKAFAIRWKKRKQFLIDMDNSELERQRQIEYEILQKKAVRKICRFLSRVWHLNHHKRIHRAFSARKDAGFSYIAGALHMAASVDPSATYFIPGVRQNTAKFNQALMQRTLICDGHMIEFASFDVIMLSSVLKHASCTIQTLIIANMDDGVELSYEFDLLPAIAACRSLRCLVILGGTFRKTFLCGVLSEIQTENPRIKEVYVENVIECTYRSQLVSELSSAGGRLLCDYFNYSLPGIHVISLHGCSLRDVDLELLNAGIAVNSSIKAVIVSHNNITDNGLIAILKSISSNRKSNIEMLDISYNLICCRQAARSALDAYIHPVISTTSTPAVLELFMSHTLMIRKYEVVPSVRGRVEMALHVTTNSRNSRKKLLFSSAYMPPVAADIVEENYRNNRHHHHHHKHKHGLHNKYGHHHHHHHHKQPPANSLTAPSSSPRIDVPSCAPSAIETSQQPIPVSATHQMARVSARLTGVLSAQLSPLQRSPSASPQLMSRKRLDSKVSEVNSTPRESYVSSNDISGVNSPSRTPSQTPVPLDAFHAAIVKAIPRPGTFMMPSLPPLQIHPGQMLDKPHKTMVELPHGASEQHATHSARGTNVTMEVAARRQMAVRKHVFIPINAPLPAPKPVDKVGAGVQDRGHDSSDSEGVDSANDSNRSGSHRDKASGKRKSRKSRKSMKKRSSPKKNASQGMQEDYSSSGESGDENENNDDDYDEDDEELSDYDDDEYPGDAESSFDGDTASIDSQSIDANSNKKRISSSVRFTFEEGGDKAARKSTRKSIVIKQFQNAYGQNASSSSKLKSRKSGAGKGLLSEELIKEARLSEIQARRTHGTANIVGNNIRSTTVSTRTAGSSPTHSRGKQVTIMKKK